jgi:hypothetical protein
MVHEDYILDSKMGTNEDNEWSPGASENHNITSMNDTDVQKVEDTQSAPTECEEPNT